MLDSQGYPQILASISCVSGTELGRTVTPWPFRIGCENRSTCFHNASRVAVLLVNELQTPGDVTHTSRHRRPSVRGKNKAVRGNIYNEGIHRRKTPGRWQFHVSSKGSNDSVQWYSCVWRRSGTNPANRGSLLPPKHAVHPRTY